MKRNEIIREYKTKKREDDGIVKDAYQRLFNTPDGKIVMDDFLRYYFKKSHVRGDSHQTAYFEGRRSMVGEIINKVFDINEYKEENEE